ncbi:hypothetical protein HK104_009821 [Borealophlyctis nickersoniae]|nr:hypothetical protein HK104_009821 [Borealophlyctis nickersoniae]
MQKDSMCAYLRPAPLFSRQKIVEETTTAVDLLWAVGAFRGVPLSNEMNRNAYVAHSLSIAIRTHAQFPTKDAVATTLEQLSCQISLMSDRIRELSVTKVVKMRHAIKTFKAFTEDISSGKNPAATKEIFELFLETLSSVNSDFAQIQDKIYPALLAIDIVISTGKQIGFQLARTTLAPNKTCSDAWWCGKAVQNDVAKVKEIERFAYELSHHTLVMNIRITSFRDWMVVQRGTVQEGTYEYHRNEVSDLGMKIQRLKEQVEEIDVRHCWNKMCM